MRLAGRPVRHDARPHVAGAGKAHGGDRQHSGEGDDRQEGQRFGGGEGSEFLHPTERGRPDQPVKADSGIGDHPRA